MNNKMYSILIPIAIIAACSLCNLTPKSLSSDVVPAPVKQGVNEYDAKYACQWFISDALVSPGSADYLPKEEIYQ